MNGLKVVSEYLNCAVKWKYVALSIIQDLYRVHSMSLDIHVLGVGKSVQISWVVKYVYMYMYIICEPV